MKLTNCCACSSTQGIFNVQCYGAKGDGETNDCGAILAARDAVNAAGGGVLFFPRGTFVVSYTIELGPSTAVLGLGASSVLQAKPGVACFNMLLVRNSDNVRVLDLVLDGNRAETSPPAEEDNENIGCGFLGLPVREGQTGLSIENVIVRNHHGSGIRITGPTNSNDLYQLNANEVEVIGCKILDCGSRGIILTLATRAHIACNVITSCMQVGIQLVFSRAAVIDGNVIQKTVQRPGTRGGHGIAAANSFDYVIVNNVANENVRWGIVASGGVGIFPPQHPMSLRYVVANNVCRANAAGGITIDPTTNDPKVIQDSFATVASNICAANQSHGIHTTHAGYLSVRGNICEGNEDNGIAIFSSRYAVVADNVLTGNGKYGIAFRGNPDDVPEIGHHLLGGNVYDRNKDGEILIGPGHPNIIRQLQDQWPSGGDGR